MKLVLGILGFVAFVAALVFGARWLGTTPAPAPAPAPSPATPVAPVAPKDRASNALPPLFVYKDDATDTPIALAGPRKKPALLHLWASWCGPCREELPSILARGRRGDVDVIAVAVDDYFKDVRAYFANQIPPEVVWDKHITLERALGVGSIPTTFLVDIHGNVVERFDGAREWAAWGAPK